MLPLLLLLACAGNGDNTSPAEPTPFRGYKVDICVITHSNMVGGRWISIAQVGGTDLLSSSTEAELVYNAGMQPDHYCAQDVQIYAENDGQAVHVRVAATQRAYVIEKVEVTYEPLLKDGVSMDNFPYTESRASCGGQCATIEAWHDPVRSDWWRFNIVSVTGTDGIPTAIVDLPGRRDL